jgi:glutathione S-transferase
MPEYTLYMANGACSFAPHALLNELSIPHNIFRMEFSADRRGWVAVDGSITMDEYRATIHPHGYVPVLKIDDEVVTENVAILTLIASLAPERHLLGRTHLERARVAEWMAWTSGMLHGYGFGMLFRPQRFVDDEALFEGVRERGRALIRGGFERIDERLRSGGSEFPVGGAETTVDYQLLNFYFWGVQNGFGMDAFTNFTALVRRMMAKESVKETVAQEALSWSI